MLVLNSFQAASLHQAVPSNLFNQGAASQLTMQASQKLPKDFSVKNFSQDQNNHVQAQFRPQPTKYSLSSDVRFFNLHTYRSEHPDRPVVYQAVRVASSHASANGLATLTSYSGLSVAACSNVTDSLSELELSAEQDSEQQDMPPSSAAATSHSGNGGSLTDSDSISHDLTKLPGATGAPPKESVPGIGEPEASVPSGDRTYRLEILQQPSLGCAFEDNLLSRIGLAAPLILELQVIDADGKNTDAGEELPFLICQCSLLEENDSTADMALLPAESSSFARASTSVSSSSSSNPAAERTGDRGSRSSGGSRKGPTSRTFPVSSSTESTSPIDGTSAALSGTSVSTAPRLGRMLYGTIVANPRTLDSPDGSRKPYLLFPEISIRSPGRFKLQCQLMRLYFPNLNDAVTGAQNQVLATVTTKMITVVRRPEYGAPQVTELSRHFARQGVSLLLPPGVSAD